MRGRRIGATMAAAATTGGAAFLLLGAGWSATAAPSAGGAPSRSLPTISLPIPTPTFSLPIPTPTYSLPIPTPTFSLPIPTPTFSLPIPTPTFTLPVPTPTIPGTPPTPTVPIPTSSNGLPLPTPTGIGPLPSLPVTLGPFPSPNSPWIPGNPPPAPGGPGGVQSLTTSYAVLGQLMDLLGTPANVGVERPSLEHFGSQVQPSTFTAAAAAARRAGSTTGAAAAGVLAVLCSLLVAAGLALISSRQTRPWYRPAGIAALPLAVILGIAAVATGPTTVASKATGAVLATARPAPTAATTTATTVSRQVPAAGYDLLARVATVENTIVEQAAQVHSLGVLAAQQVPGTADQASGRLTGGSSSDYAGEQQAMAASLETTLQHEYDLFASIAANPSQASALVAAAATQPPSIRDAVSYDVQAVQAALAQQTAIARVAAADSQAQSSGAASRGIVPSGIGVPGGLPTLTLPVAGPISQGFGPTLLAFEPAILIGGIGYPHFHTGLDIAGPVLSTVHATADGIVALAGSETDGYGHLVGYGNYVVIAHGGGMITLYGHLDKILAGAGQAVSAGDPIGLEGSTGNSTGPHVHFEVRINGTPVDPRLFL